MEAKTLESIQFDALRLYALLESIEHLLPNDKPKAETQPQLLTGFAADLAKQIAQDIDLYDTTQSKE